MWNNIPDATTRRAVRRLFATYLAVSGLAYLFPHRPDSWPLLLALHVAGIGFVLRPQLIGPVRKTRAGAVIADWYLILLIPALYTELATLNIAVHNGRYFDSIILGWEQTLFGGQPSRELATWFPYLPLSEFLHFSYLSYYFIIYIPPLILYMRKQRELQRQMIFNMLLAFFGHYVFFIYFPVSGPRYLFAAPAGEISRGWFYRFAHKLLEAGSSRGAAFPSSHVGVSVAQTAFTFAKQRYVAPIILVLSVGLLVGAVYGGFHYATDALAGLAWGLFLFAMAPRVAGWLGR